MYFTLYQGSQVFFLFWVFFFTAREPKKIPQTPFVHNLTFFSNIRLII